MNLAEKYKSLLERYKVNTPLRKAHFFAQADHESALLTRRENLNYKDPLRIAQMFRSPFDLDKDRVIDADEIAFAKKYVGNPVALGNYAYANRYGNGNVASGDGYKYRGGGFFMITFKDNYEDLSIDTGIDFLNNPDLLLVEANSMVAALWFWVRINGNALADADNIEAITKRVNGGYNGLEDRKAKLRNYKKIFGV